MDYLDEQLNAMAQKPEFKLSDLADDAEQPVRNHTVVPSYKHDEAEEDYNSLENRLKNIRKNLNFDQCLEELDQTNLQKGSKKDEKEVARDSLKDKYRSFIANMKMPAAETECTTKDLEDKSQL